MTTKFDPAAIMAAHRARHAAMGLGSRCPVCNAGIGKFCIGGKDGGFAPSHVERIDSARQGIHAA